MIGLPTAVDISDSLCVINLKSTLNYVGDVGYMKNKNKNETNWHPFFFKARLFSIM